MDQEARARMKKILELQRKLRFQRAFKKSAERIFKPASPPKKQTSLQEDSDVEYTDVEMLEEAEDPELMKQTLAPPPAIKQEEEEDSFFDTEGFTRYDIMELNGDGTECDNLSESVIVQHSKAFASMLEPEIKIKTEPTEIKIKSEPDDVFVHEPPEASLEDLIPPELRIKIEEANKRIFMRPSSYRPVPKEYQEAEINRVKQEIINKFQSCDGTSELLIPKIKLNKPSTPRFTTPRFIIQRNQNGFFVCDICGKFSFLFLVIIF